MSVEHLASIYYGYIIEDNDVLFNADKTAAEKYLDDDWYINDLYGQSFYPHCWEEEGPLVLGIEGYDTEDIIDITDYAMSQIVEKTKEGLMEIYKELFPNRDEIPEPRFLLIQREF